jgi:transposase
MEKQPNITPEMIEENLLRIEQLAAENQKLLEENARFFNTIEDQSTIINDQNTTIDGQNTTIDGQNATIADLKFQVAQFQRMIFGSKRERFVSDVHPSQLTIPFDFGDKKVEAVIEADKQQISYEHTKPSKPHPGRFQIPSHVPVEKILVEPTEDVSGMEKIGVKITSELEYIPGSFKRIDYIRDVYITKEDETGTQRQVIAPLERPMPKCMAGPGLISQIMVDKFQYHMPLHRQIQRFKQENIHIPASTMDSWFSLCSNHIRPLYAVHKAYILENPYLQVDESPIKVQDRDKPGATHQGYMWVYHAPMQNAVFFDYHKGRGLDAPLKNLSNFKGYLQTDGYAVYEHFGRKEDVTHLACWVHARRMVEKALDNDKARASTVLLWIQKLYAIERFAREDGLSDQDRHELRLQQALPILNEISRYIADQYKQVLPKSPIGKAFEYCIHRWDNLMNYLKDGNLETDNNAIENAIRGLALGRKNFMFAGSHHGAENIAIFYSFFGTCKKHDINPQKWLEYVIRNINDTKKSQLKYLLPQFIDKNLLK